MKKFFLTTIMICAAMIMNAATLTGNGTGDTEDKAKNQATIGIFRSYSQSKPHQIG